ncbi:Isoprenyl transferase 2 [Streptomyces ambofaciens ATCC 23877]|uniref:Isoprenyl transferase n=1 Tax=Streptomyces ambofaciens (strain ATCC 23877 / 3486 / DSM 40053 / JCM 4204 / NBRC 12836 / NRRL B-2516) TaxID=278992 RepID=A0A0K2AJJ6_STRA7|nr:Isoprenyl transferase 2 [Streptomyces ambofaciens ATCC 23877]AKZ60589.1 Isoprenyl transferase 2 [Streptomyces ambofaciens ATCC 23877]
MTKHGAIEHAASSGTGPGLEDRGVPRARADPQERPGAPQYGDGLGGQRQDGRPVRGVPRHVACVMDGNGRWAQRRSLPRTDGHRAAETTVIDTIEAARAAGVEWLSLYAFSTENWNRPGPEVAFLMRLVRRVVRKHAPLLLARGIRCRFLGAADPRIPRELARDFEDLTTLTAGNRGMTLTVAFDHGGRRDIVEAARSLIRGGTAAEEVTEQLFADHLPFPDTPDVDLVIRTSGEQRISNFMLWQVAYAEWVFPEVLWPDFRASDFLACLHTYRCRDRRFGGVPAATNGDRS